VASNELPVLWDAGPRSLPVDRHRGAQPGDGGSEHLGAAGQFKPDDTTSLKTVISFHLVPDACC
jgi:hypothetical protein